MRTSEQLGDICAALVNFQAELAPVAKDATNPHLKNRYASLDAIWEAIRPLLAKHGLAIIQGPTSDPERHGGAIGMTTRIVHQSGQWIEASVTIPIGEVGKGRNLAQEIGSTITYLRRYCLSAALGVVADEDDDSGTPPAPAKRPPARKPAAKKPAGGNGAQAAVTVTEEELFGPQPARDDKKAYWDSIGPIERACYRSWDNVLGSLGDLDHYDGNQFRVTGAIKKLYPGFEKNGYPTKADERAGRIRVAVYRTVKAYGELRAAGKDGNEAAGLAFETAKNLAPA